MTMCDFGVVYNILFDLIFQLLVNGSLIFFPIHKLLIPILKRLAKKNRYLIICTVIQYKNPASNIEPPTLANIFEWKYICKFCKIFLLKANTKRHYTVAMQGTLVSKNKSSYTF